MSSGAQHHYYLQKDSDDSREFAPLYMIHKHELFLFFYEGWLLQTLFDTSSLRRDELNSAPLLHSWATYLPRLSQRAKTIGYSRTSLLFPFCSYFEETGSLELLLNCVVASVAAEWLSVLFLDWKVVFKKQQLYTRIKRLMTLKHIQYPWIECKEYVCAAVKQ